MKSDNRYSSKGTVAIRFVYYVTSIYEVDTMRVGGEMNNRSRGNCQ